MPYIIRMQEACSQTALGGKARALASLRDTGLSIPAWFVLTPRAFDDSVSHQQRHALDAAIEDATLMSIVAEVQAASAVVAELQAALAELCPDGAKVAVRSSALDEDGADHSFAGQLDSFLFIPLDRVAARVEAVWRSAFNPRVLVYRRKLGLNRSPRIPAVLIQRMVEPEVSGVAFGADPLTGRPGTTVIAAVYGLGTALVSGACEADTYKLDRDGNLIERTLARKCVAHRHALNAGEGIQAEPVAEALAQRPALRDDQVLAVARLAWRLGEHFGRQQDLEWAFAQDQLYLLQSRPITTPAFLPARSETGSGT